MGKISAHDIFREVKREIFNLKNTGELSIVITDGLTEDDMLKAYWQEENEITVQFGGRKITVPCKITSTNDDYIARSIMHGFAQLYLYMLSNKEDRNESTRRRKNGITESRLRRIVKESVSKILNESNDIEIVDGNFGTITYLSLFDYMDFEGRFPYIVKYSNKAYYVPTKDKYQLAQPIKSKAFKTHKECAKFCQENGIEVIDEINVNHPLSKGIPDARSIKPWSSPRDFS